MGPSAPRGRPERAGRPSAWASALLAVAILATLALLLAASFLGPAASPAPSARGAPAGPRLGLEARAASPRPAAGGILSIVKLSINATPEQICEGDSSDCPLGIGESTVSMSVHAGVRGNNQWPAVQVVFLLETTPYDGVYDPSASVPGSDPCGDTEVGTSTLCDESNLVPFFVTNAGAVAQAVQAAQPNTTYSFALVDYFATHDQWDTGGGTTYHADVAHFVNASSFGPAVVRDFQDTALGGGFVIPHSDLYDNFLDSDSISALYATLAGWDGVNWSATSHHVIVQVGSTAPRDPSYPENYCVSPAVTPKGLGNCTASTCEPSITFGQNESPGCEGWIQSQTENRSETIAEFAHVAPDCVDSLGGNCTIDEIDVNNTPTNPNSPSWSAAGGAGGPFNWTLDADGILQAGCDMAAATNGTWDGPSWFTCASLHVKGNLPYVPIVSADQPSTSNPKLFGALTNFGLSTVPNPVIALGTSVPLYTFVPWGLVAPTPDPGWLVICTNATGAKLNCPQDPTVSEVEGVPTYGWNWSDIPERNEMHLGDSWTVYFQIYADGPPFGLQPVDACITRACIQAGSGAVGPAYTSTTFLAYGSTTTLTFAFGLAQIDLEALTSVPLPTATPPPKTNGAPPPISASPPAPPPTASAAAPIPASLVPMEAASSGFIAAGFIRLGIRRPGVSQRQATPQGETVIGRYKKPPPAVGRWS
jgi:hypothetical protein